MILCNECGNPLGEKANFCADCGASTRSGSTSRSATVRHEEHRRTREYWESIHQSESENRFWDAIKNSKDAEKFHEYLKTFPNGAFAEIARSRIRELSEAQALASLFRNY